MSLHRLSLSARIYMAFSILIVLMGLLLAICLVGTSTLTSAFNERAGVAATTNVVRERADALDVVRLNFNQYRANPNQANQDILNTSMAVLPEDDIAQFSDAVGGLIQLNTNISRASEEMRGLGTQATETMVTLVSELAFVPGLTPSVTARAATAQSRILMMRLEGEALLSGDSEATFNAREHADLADQAFNTLRYSVINTPLDEMVTATRADIAAFIDAMGRVNNMMAARKGLESGVMMADNALLQSYTQALEEAQGKEQEITELVESQSGQITIIAASAGGIALLLGVVFAVMTARWLAREISRIAESMTRLSDGEFSVDINNTDRADELGRIARALQVFGQNGKTLAASRSREEAERAEAAQAAERWSRLKADLGAVVDSALDGDFHARLEHDYGSEDLDALAKSVNALMETVAHGVQENANVLANLAAARLDQRVDGDFRGVFQQLQNDTNALAESLSGTMEQLSDASQALRRATREILSGTDNLADRTHRQASVIETTVRSVEMLATQLDETAALAHRAADSAKESAQLANNGNNAMSRLLQAMEEIRTSSDQISSITGMIEDIAFQTNLLALNASVEAARAGDAGKGFAVVAVEVRRLAQSAANASSDIKQLTTQSSTAVAGGTRIAKEAAQVLSAIHEVVDRSSAEMEQIAASAQFQSQSIVTIAQSMRDMDSDIHQNAALVEESHASIDQTRAQAEALDEIVSRFTQGDEDRQEVAA